MYWWHGHTDLAILSGFRTTDLIGIPHRLVISPKTLAVGNVEWKPRTATEATLLSLDAFINQLQGKKKAA